MAKKRGKEHHCEFDDIEVLTENSCYCVVLVTHMLTLGELVALLDSFKAQPKTLVMPEISEKLFAKRCVSLT